MGVPHDAESVRQFDIMKGVAAVVLLVLAIIPWLRAGTSSDLPITPFALTGASAVGQAVRLTGKGLPGAEVALLDGSAILTEGLVNDAGEWTLDLPVPFSDPATIKVREADPKEGSERTLGFSGAPSFIAAVQGFPNGGRRPDAASPPSAPVDTPSEPPVEKPPVTEPSREPSPVEKPAPEQKDEQKPEPPQQAQPAIPLALASSSFASGTGLLKGTAPAGQRVVVSVEGTVVCAAVAGEDGSWTCEAEILRPGSRRVTVSAGKASAEASLDVSAPAKAAASQVRRAITYPRNGARRQAGPVQVYGWGKPGETVTIRVGRHLKRQVQVDPNGRWTARFSLMRGVKPVAAQIGPERRGVRLRIR